MMAAGFLWKAYHFLASAFLVFFLTLAGLVFPKLPANVFPFLVLISPRPMVKIILIVVV